MPSVTINSKSKFTEYTSKKSLTVVDFTATWCGPCKAVSPRFEKLSDEYKNVNFLKVDVDNNQDISKENSVSAMPTFKFFINGKCVDEVVGADINKVENIIKRLSDGAGAASFTGGGRVLGSGATANASTTQDKNHQYLMYGLILVFLGYIYFSKGSGEL